MEEVTTYIDVVTPQRQWRFHEGFLRSSWRCIYGGGCRGLHVTQNPGRFDGCCTEGAALTDADDFMIVSRAVSLLDPSTWQHAPAAKRLGWHKRLPNGIVGTRVVDAACIFLNRPGFSTGPGCALHFASIGRGERPIDGKPNVCWQFPLRRNDSVGADGVMVSTIQPWLPGDWKAAGGTREWFCTSAPEAFDAVDPVWKTLAAELQEIVGSEVYAELVRRLRRD